MIMPQTDLPGAVRCAERVRADIERLDFAGVADDRLTVTAGVACLARGENLKALLARVDAALYDGKAAGRNRVVAVG